MPPLEVDVPPRFSASGSAEVEARWWTSFGRPELDSLVARSLASNPDLKTAWARLREAEAVAGIAAAPLWPDLRAEAGAAWRDDEFAQSEDWSAGLAAGYEVDLWGAIRATAQAERARVRASAADVRTVAVTLSAEVALVWCRSIEAHGQIELLEEQRATNADLLRSIELRFERGQVRSVDVLRQRQLLASTDALLVEARARATLSRHSLAVLLGRPPRSDLGPLGTTLPDLPPLPETGVPSELVSRRPDVRRAHLELRAADRDLAAAASRRYPRLNLTASVSTVAEEPSNLFGDWVTAFAGDLFAPLFTGGELSSRVDRARAVTEQRLHEYASVILVAFREVEDALELERRRAERVDVLREQLEFARRATTQLRASYLNGLADYLDVLTAITEEQRLQRDLLAARRARLEARIALHRALAGGFVPTPEETT